MKRRNPINKNSIPFLLLALIHLLLLFPLMKRKRGKETWILLLSNMGFAYFFEYFVLNILGAYTYKPRIFKKRAIDNMFGTFFSQGLFIPLAATFISVFQKDWKWKVLVSFFYYFIEKLFLRLKVYKENWWRPIFTFIFINGYFFLSDGFLTRLKTRKSWVLKVACFFSVEVFHIILMFQLAVRKKIRFGLGRFHPLKEHFLISPLYSLGLTFISVFAAKSGKVLWLLRLLIPTAIDIVLIKIKILKIKRKDYRELFLVHSLIEALSRYFHFLIHK